MNEQFQDRFQTQITHIAKDRYQVTIWGVDMGEWEKSDLRHLIQKLDNAVYQ